MGCTEQCPSLKGLRVFAVEDEFHVLLLLEDMLSSLGCDVVATATTLATALQTATTCIVDVAILDINLAEQRVFPVAELLRTRNIPIVFCTGYGRSGIDAEWQSSQVLEKPYLIEQLAQAIAHACLPEPRESDQTSGEPAIF
jgi:CheY-like chemotaxis protein